MITEPIKEIIISVVIAVVILFTGAILERAFAATPQENCEIKGGVWEENYCAPPDMSEDDIKLAQRYVVLKELEMREVNNVQTTSR